MGKRRGGKKRVSGGIVHATLTLREEASGKSRPKDVKSILKLKHLLRLAEWSSGEASIPSLGALFGHRFAGFGESLGLPPDNSLFPCQRCETLFRPTFNCNVRIEKNRSKRRRRGSKTKRPAQNNTVYICNFCSHRNMKPGTLKGYARHLAPLKAKTCLKPKAGDLTTAQARPDAKRSDTNKLETSSTLLSNVSTSVTHSPTSLAATGVKLLDGKRRKRKKPGLKESTDKAGGTSRKRKKSWTSLKEMAATEEDEWNQRFKNITVPFIL